MKPLETQQGAAMILVLMVMMVLTILTVAMLQFTYTEVLHVSIEEQSKQAYYLARTGAEAAVSVWLQEAAMNKPEGKVQRVYFNVETDEFQIMEPIVSGGYFDVAIKREDDSEGLWKITSTGTVGNQSRTVHIITFPFAHGLDLGWYDEDGEIQEGHFKELDEEFIYLSLNTSKVFIPKEKDDFHGSFSAKQIIFGSPLKIDLGIPDSQGNIYEANVNTKEFTVEAEGIFFHDVEISHCPARNYSNWFGTWSRPEGNGKIILKVPDELEGVPYNEVPGGIIGRKYGKVYFDGENVFRKNYQWNANWLLGFYNFRIVPQNKVQIAYNGNNLASNSYYFRSGIDLLNLKSGDLIPFNDDTERPALRGIKPYYWE